MTVAPAAVASACPECGTEYTPRAAFCRKCGKPVATATPAGAHTLARPAKCMGRGAIALAIAGGVALMVVVAAIQVALKGDDGGGEASSKAAKPGGGQSEAAYAPRKVAPATAEPQSVNGKTSADGETTLSLPDGTQVKLPRTAKPVGVTLSRQTNTSDLGRPGMTATGSVRVLEFDAAVEDDAFAPVVSIPASEAGDVAFATLQMARVSDTYMNGDVARQKALYLPVTADANGNLVAADYLFASTVPSGAGAKGSATSAAGVVRVGYVLSTFQDDFDWQEAPRLVRMTPDHSTAGRHPAEWDTDSKPPPPLVNVVILIHGHNEAEKSGVQKLTEAPEPWRAAYKRDVWTLLYKNYQELQKFQAPCTTFYEYIYPTYRPIFSDLVSKTARGERVTYSALGGELAELLAADPLIAEQIEANKDFNLFVVAHSQGGVMARAGMQPIYDGSLAEPARSALQRDLQKIVTWGSPHHGSAIWTMGYAFRFAPDHYRLDYEQLSLTLTTRYPELATIKWGSAFLARREILPRVADLAIDAPSVRDMLWDNMTGELRLDEWFDYPPGKSAEGTDFELRGGARLYSNALREFNERDMIPKAKYAFVAGITSKTIVTDAARLAALTGFGATINRILVGPDPDGLSDGASTYNSETAKGIAGEIILVGDIDHEEYYGAALDGAFPQEPKARKTFDATFDSAGADLRAERCKCPTLAVGAPNNDSVTSPEKLAVKATLKWPVELDKKPGGRIDRTEVVLSLEGGRSLGPLDWKAGSDGVVNLSGSLDVSGVALGPHQVAVRAWFFDGTMLQSENATFVQRSGDPTKAPTAAATTTAGTGQWVLKSVKPGEAKSSINERVEGVPCNVVTTFDSGESNATVTSTGGCQHPQTKPIATTSQHSWGRPPDRITPGQEVTLTGSASQAGVCGINGATGKDCPASTSPWVGQGDKLPGGTGAISWTQVFNPPGSAWADSATRPSATWTFKAPTGSKGKPTLFIKFVSKGRWGTVETHFWYEWQGP